MLYEIQFDRTTLSEQEEEKIEQLVYDHLKGLNSNQTQIKCNVGDGPIGDLVEEITISRPILVRWRGFLACTLIRHTLGVKFWFRFCLIRFDYLMFQFHDAKYEDIDFFIYTVNDHGAEVETINVSSNINMHFTLRLHEFCN